MQIMAYNNPFSFRANMSRSTWDRLLTLEKIKAVKESNGDTAHRANVVAHISDRINVFAGGEHWFLPDALLGANGIVGIVAPGAMAASLAFYEACMARNLDLAVPMHAKYNDLASDITGENEVGWLKACAELGGVNAGAPRSPYAAIDAGLRKRLKAKLEELKALVARGMPAQ
jgi:4-hydroxy-tetrahydrodipicolinate synthase